MKMPREMPVMTLPNATLFPQAFLPLYIFESRYRQMLGDALRSHRMFAVAMQKPGNARETPLPVAGVGLIRVSVAHRDGTSHLILQGLTRVEVEQAVRYKPYRVHRVRPLKTPPCNDATADVLVGKVHQLLAEWVKLGVPFPFPAVPQSSSHSSDPQLPRFSAREMLNYLDSIRNPEHAADLVSCAVLPDAAERQVILETVDVEDRLRRLIYFLTAEIGKRKHGGSDE